MFWVHYKIPNEKVYIISQKISSNIYKFLGFPNFDIMKNILLASVLTQLPLHIIYLDRFSYTPLL